LTQKYNQQLLKLNSQLEEDKKRDKTFERDLKRCIEKIPDLHRMCSQSDIEGKSRLLGSTFPQKLEFDGKKCRTAYLNSIILRILLMDKEYSEKKNRTNFSKFGVVRFSGEYRITA